MEQLQKIYGAPHELLHLLALILIGRRAVKFAQDHVIVPSDLTTAQYVFVAALPAIVFFTCMAIGVLALINAQTPGQAGIGVGVIIAAGIGAAGTFGDLELIWQKLSQNNSEP
ncbi:MAG: hypothetical protein GC204_04240 [Chloroflexi bacterium]|nr:hypothetical protein [Chloroflexota bacterium]